MPVTHGLKYYKFRSELQAFSVWSSLLKSESIIYDVSVCVCVCLCVCVCESPVIKIIFVGFFLTFRFQLLSISASHTPI